MFEDFFEETLPTLDRVIAFKLLDSVIPKRSTLPVIMCVKITGKDGYLEFEGTDLDLAVKVRVQNYLDFQGVAVVPWKEFKPQAGLVPVDKMESLAPDDFPVLPKVDGKDIGVQWLNDGHRCLYAVSYDPSRISLNGVYVHESGCVATDGHRLHYVPGSYDCQAIVPPRVFTTMKVAPEHCTVTSDRVFLLYQWGHIVSKLLEGPYPKYPQLIPDNRGDFPSATVPTLELINACTRAVELNPKYPLIRLEAGKLEIKGPSGWIETATLSEYPEDFAIQFNAKYVLDTVKGLGPETRIHSRGSLSAAFFNVHESQDTRILMPTRPDKGAK